MLGRTHMAIGGVGAVVAAPLLLHSSWQNMRQQLVGDNWHSFPHILIAQAVIVASTVVGAVLPDLDQRDSLMAHKVEVIGGVPILAVLVAMVFALHQASSLIAWGVVVVLGVLFNSQKNVTRIIGLGLVGVGFLYLGWAKHMPMLSAILLAVWLVGAMFTKHRTFTHSLPGLAIFGAGVLMSGGALGSLHLAVAAPGFVVGYALHMAADFPAGGIPLLWPWSKRQGLHLVKTGGAVDHLIGGICILGFVALALL